MPPGSPVGGAASSGATPIFAYIAWPTRTHNASISCEPKDNDRLVLDFMKASNITFLMRARAFSKFPAVRAASTSRIHRSTCVIECPLLGPGTVACPLQCVAEVDKLWVCRTRACKIHQVTSLQNSSRSEALFIFVYTLVEPAV